MMREFSKKFASVLLSATVALSFLLAPVSQTLDIRRAEAIGGIGDVVLDPTNLVQNAISATVGKLISKATDANWWKEYVLDPIGWGLVNMMVKEMIKSTTKWVNSGFEGDPAFVTDLEGFMLDVADKVAGDFIWGSNELKFLCSPFAFDVKLALDLQYRDTRSDYQSQCTLSDVVDNMDNFFSGDFLEGGWDGWYAVTQNPKNNPYGALLEAQDALSIKIGGKKLYEDKLLGFGEGFLSQKKCKKITIAGDLEDGSDSEEKEVCDIVTPGTTIENSLNTALDLPAGRLQVADELNELLGALLSQLASTIFSSAGGLLGSTQSSGGGGSIFDALDREQDPSNPTPSSSFFDSAITEERSYVDTLTEIVDMILGARNYWKNRYADNDESPRTASEERCYDAGVTDFPQSLLQALSEAEIELGASSSTIATLEGLRNDLTLLTDSQTSSTTITQLLTKYGADSVPAARATIANRFTAIQSSGVLHSVSDQVELEQVTRPRIEEQVATFMANVDRTCGGGDSGGGD